MAQQTRSRCGHLRERGFAEYECSITGVSVDEQCLIEAEGLKLPTMCVPRLALRYRAHSLDMDRFPFKFQEVIMRQAQQIDENQIVVRPGMTEAEMEAAWGRLRELRRAIAYGKRKLEPLREHAKQLMGELKATTAAINDLEEGRIPKVMPKVRLRVRTEEQKAAAAAIWSPERRAAQAERLRQGRREWASKHRAEAKAKAKAAAA